MVILGYYWGLSPKDNENKFCFDISYQASGILTGAETQTGSLAPMSLFLIPESIFGSSL